MSLSCVISLSELRNWAGAVIAMLPIIKKSRARSLRDVRERASSPQLNVGGALALKKQTTILGLFNRVVSAPYATEERFNGIAREAQSNHLK